MLLFLLFFQPIFCPLPILDVPLCYRHVEVQAAIWRSFSLRRRGLVQISDVKAVVLEIMGGIAHGGQFAVIDLVGWIVHWRVQLTF